LSQRSSDTQKSESNQIGFGMILLPKETSEPMIPTLKGASLHHSLGVNKRPIYLYNDVTLIV